MKRVGMIGAFARNSIWARQKTIYVSADSRKTGACRRHPTRPLRGRDGRLKRPKIGAESACQGQVG
jgi:hypothetical protein